MPDRGRKRPRARVRVPAGTWRERPAPAVAGRRGPAVGGRRLGLGGQLRRRHGGRHGERHRVDDERPRLARRQVAHDEVALEVRARIGEAADLEAGHRVELGHTVILDRIGLGRFEGVDQRVIDRYIDSFEKRLKGEGFSGRFSIMQSNGGRLPAEAIRRILIDQARRKASLKAGGQWQRLDLSDVEPEIQGPQIDLIALDSALEQLTARDPRAAQQIAKSSEHGVGRFDVAVHQGRNRVQGVEQEMRLQLALERLQLRLDEVLLELSGLELAPL